MNTLGTQVGEKIKEVLNKKPTKFQTGILWVGGFALFIGVLYIGSLFSSNEDFETKLLQTQAHNIDIELGKLGEQHNVYEKTRQKQQQAVDNTVTLMKGLEDEAKILRAKKNEVEEKVKQVRATKHGILPQANAAELPGLTTVIPQKTQEEAIKEEKRPVKKNASKDQQEKVDYAWEISKDPYFIYLLEAENGLWTHDRRHNPINNTVGIDWGFCGTNDYFHPEKVGNPLFFSDWKWQARTCLAMFKGGTKFYGASPSNRAKASLDFIWE